jgi:chromosome segregation ATPase
MRRIGLGTVLALSLAAAFAAAGDPAKPDEGSGAPSEQLTAAWEARLSEAQARITTARERAESSERALTRARHRKYPRGEALDQLVASAEDARRELAAAEEELPALLEQAHAEGVEPGVLRRFEADE